MGSGAYNKYGSVNTAYVPGKGYTTVSSFSGADIQVDAVFPGTKPIKFGTASTVSYSTFREMRQVRTLGRITQKGITRGPRTVGGTIVFTVINQHFINDIKENVPYLYKYGKIKPDELPPFDLVVTFANEYGQTAKMVIYGVTFIEDSKTLSIEDIMTESVTTYMARDIDHMKGPIDKDMNLYIERGQILNESNRPVPFFTIDQVQSEEDYYAYLQQVKLRTGPQNVQDFN